MAEGVVEALEPVEIHEQQTGSAAVAFDSSGDLGQVFVEAQPVAEAREGVEARDALQFLVQPQKLGLLDNQGFLLHEQEFVLSAQIQLVLLHAAVESTHGEDLAVHLSPPAKLDLVRAEAEGRSEGGKQKIITQSLAGVGPDFFDSGPFDVYDYVDAAVPVLARVFKKRQAAYRPRRPDC